MGVDWTPARVRDGVDPVELAALAAEHARLNQLHGRGAEFGPDVVWEAPPREVTELWRDVDRRLLACLDIPRNDEGYWHCFRVAVIGHNPLFPQEWRDAAWTTLLPEHAAAEVARWRRHYTEVREGLVPVPADAELDWAADFFAWAQPWLDTGHGFYLWS
ncbi:hypothetical protein [Yinghuangia sp. YIM S09857]|uniref:hypothetical protein n=1 Tax=Yinghuangia sp. YIM S09857 TaxID=3436929 RepID=UPI003F530F44